MQFSKNIWAVFIPSTFKFSLNINKLLLLRRKNRPEIKASFMFNILGTIADNLRAVIEFTPIWKKTTKVLSYHLKQKTANISWEQVMTIRQLYHRFRWYATLENKTPAETFPKFPSIIRVIDMSDRNPPITATSVTVWPSLRHASGLWLVDFDPTCR